MGRIGRVKIPFLIDVGIDDVIVPNPIKRSIITRLPDFVSSEVFTYSLESTIAEKFDAILQRMAGTSRMKDFYDIEIIVETFALVKLKKCLPHGLVMPWLISTALFHGGKNVDQPFGLSGFLDDFLNPVIFAESP
ncbi:MAG TPA: hypothetical protein DCZ91_16380, partial [Lachnospiraceae bacterium]|nr:hypothetical protein [Lachnospiraceae bacterium]